MSIQGRAAHRLSTRTAQLRCGASIHDKGYVERAFCTPQFAVVYLHEGEGRFEDDKGHSFPLKKGCIFLRFPGRVHTVTMNAASTRAFLAVPCQIFDLFHMTGLVSIERPVLNGVASPKTLQQFVDLREALQSCSEADLFELLVRMQGFLASLLRREGKVQQGGAYGAAITTAIQLLNEDVAGRMRLPEVARQVGMGYSSFRKRFVALTGTTPREYQIRRRIERAMALLTNESYRVKEVAAQLGYPDEYAFSAQFKKVAGVSPTGFRRMN